MPARRAEVLLFELKAYLNQDLGARKPDAHVRSLAEPIVFNKQNTARDLAIFGQELFEQAVAKPGFSDKAYLAPRASASRSRGPSCSTRSWPSTSSTRSWRRTSSRGRR